MGNFQTAHVCGPQFTPTWSNVGPGDVCLVGTYVGPPVVEPLVCAVIGGGISAEELRLDVLQVLALLLIINELRDGGGGVGGGGGGGVGGGFPPRLHRRVQFFKLWSPQFLDETDSFCSLSNRRTICKEKQLRMMMSQQPCGGGALSIT